MNGERVQDAKLGEELIFGFGDIVADLSRLMTLEPGDVVLTGTPAGSTVVQPGDVVEVEVTAGDVTTGRLRTPIEADPEPLAPWGAMPGATAQDVRDAYGHDMTTDAGPVAAAASDDPLADRFGAEVAAGLRTVRPPRSRRNSSSAGSPGAASTSSTPTRPGTSRGRLRPNVALPPVAGGRVRPPGRRVQRPEAGGRGDPPRRRAGHLRPRRARRRDDRRHPRPPGRAARGGGDRHRRRASATRRPSPPSASRCSRRPATRPRSAVITCRGRSTWRSTAPVRSSNRAT